MLCPYCKEEINDEAIKCKHCGSMLQGGAPAQVSSHGRNKVAAGLLGIFLGGFGVHKFYLGQIVWGIIYLTMSDEAFARKYDSN